MVVRLKKERGVRVWIIHIMFQLGQYIFFTSISLIYRMSHLQVLLKVKSIHSELWEGNVPISIHSTWQPAEITFDRPPSCWNSRASLTNQAAGMLNMLNFWFTVPVQNNIQPRTDPQWRNGCLCRECMINLTRNVRRLSPNPPNRLRCWSYGL